MATEMAFKFQSHILGDLRNAGLGWTTEVRLDLWFELLDAFLAKTFPGDYIIIDNTTGANLFIKSPGTTTN